MEKKLQITLDHSGIKGMKWGVRRKRGPDGRVSKDYSTSRKLLNKKVPTLSNEEISKINKRLKLESELSKQDPRANAIARRQVQSFMSKYGNVVISGVAGMAGGLSVGLISKGGTNVMKKVVG